MSAPPKVIERARQQAKAVQWSCHRKRRFSDELTARAAAQIEIEHRSTRRDGEMWVYPCETCRGFHLTNRPSGAKRKVTLEHLFPPPDPDLEDGVLTPQLGGYWASDGDAA